jgi:hypothetical protein
MREEGFWMDSAHGENGTPAALLQIRYKSSACSPSGVISYLPSRTISQPDLTISSPVCKEQAG